MANITYRMPPNRAITPSSRTSCQPMTCCQAVHNRMKRKQRERRAPKVIAQRPRGRHDLSCDNRSGKQGLASDVGDLKAGRRAVDARAIPRTLYAASTSFCSNQKTKSSGITLPDSRFRFHDRKPASEQTCTRAQAVLDAAVARRRHWRRGLLGTRTARMPAPTSIDNGVSRQIGSEEMPFHECRQ